ncbi:MAG TPA: hypothetical protein VF870_14225, partial [Ignavibacteriaceae bacterium]
MKKISTIVLILMFTLPYLKAQDSRQNYEGLKIPEPGSSINVSRDKIMSGISNVQKSETITNPDNPLNTFTVTTNADDGVGSFRDAITKANETSGADVI